MMCKVWQGICLAGCFVLGSGGLVNAEAPVPVSTYQQWLQYKAKATNDPALVRFYTFEEVKDGKVKNMAGVSGDLAHVDYKAKPGEPYAEEIRIVPGRWPEKKAVRLDQCSLHDAGTYSNAGAGEFTSECWVRIKKYGKIQLGGGSSALINPNGTFITVGGNGYHAGWRLMAQGRDARLTLQIGSTNPLGGVCLDGGAIPFDTWHHLAVTWDGKKMCVYVNGKITGTRDHSEKYVDHKGLVIGYTGAGVGSLLMDLDETAVYRRALTAEEIARHFNLQP